MKKRVIILGSTGSIGTATLEVIANHPQSFDVAGLACASNIELLNEQIDRFRPKMVCVFDPERKNGVNPQGARLYTGIGGMKEMIRNEV
ncbi:MAG: 1-deoxy-D-xylulose-5-phosphate reductoisomerase, partial [Syntrophorhabdus sp.]